MTADHNHLPDVQRRVLDAMRNEGQGDATVRMSLRELSQETRTVRSSVVKALAGLTRRGYIVRHDRTPDDITENRPYAYTLTDGGE